MKNNINNVKPLNNSYVLKGKKLQGILAENDITQMEFSEMLDINMSELSKMIHNKRTTPADTLNKMCDLLQINATDIVNETKELHKEKNIPITASNYKWNRDYFNMTLKAKGMTIHELCKIIKRNTTNFSSYGLGKTRPSIQTVNKICKTLGCNPKELINVSGEELNDILGYKLFEIPCEIPCDSNNNITDKSEITAAAIENTDASTDKDTNESNLEVDESANEKMYVPEYKHFENQNVILNMEIINENILMLAKDFENKYKSLYAQVDELKNQNKILTDKISTLEDKLAIKSQIKDTLANNVNNDNNSIHTATIWENNRCSDKEMDNIVNSTIVHDTSDDYKRKIYKLVSYISRKKNLIFNQILHDSYTQFTNTYGINPNELRKEAKLSNTIDAIYNHPLAKDIFFNMMCSNATNV
mgnify:FL=1